MYPLAFHIALRSNHRQQIRIYDCTYTFSDNNFINRLRSVVMFKEGKRYSIGNSSRFINSGSNGPLSITTLIYRLLNTDITFSTKIRLRSRIIRHYVINNVK